MRHCLSIPQFHSSVQSGRWKHDAHGFVLRFSSACIADWNFSQLLRLWSLSMSSAMDASMCEKSHQVAPLVGWNGDVALFA